MSDCNVPAKAHGRENDLLDFVPESKPTAATKAHLEGIVRQFVEALNNHDIGPDAPVWQHFDKTLFRIDQQGPAFTTIASYLDGPLFARMERHTMDLDQFIKSREVICDKFPHHRARVVRLDTTLGDKGRNGQVLIYAEVRGMPEGYARPTTAAVDFMLMGKLRDGQWRVVKMQTFPGMALSDGI